MTMTSEAPEITRMNADATRALRIMLADKQRTEIRRTPAMTRAQRRATRYRPMGMR